MRHIYILACAVFLCNFICTGQNNTYLQIGWEGKEDGGKKQGDWKYFSKEGKLVIAESYLNDTLNGPYIVFDSLSGLKRQSGGYYKGKKNGIWKDYFEGRLVHSIQYDRNDLNGLYAHYDSATGAVKTQGYFLDNKLHGFVLTYSADGSNVIRKVKYSRGALDGEARFYDSQTHMMFLKGNYFQGKKDGAWEYYYPATGKRQKVELFKNGLLEGESIYYDSVTEAVSHIIPYANGKYNGMYVAYHQGTTVPRLKMLHDNGVAEGTYTEQYKSGKLSVSGNYKKGYRTGEWVYYNEYDDKPWITINYLKDVIDGRLYCYFPGGKVKRKYMFKNGEFVSGTCYDDNGDKIPCDQFIIMPEYKSDIMTFLGENIHYSKTMIADKIDGKVKVGFTINKYGNVENLAVVEGYTEECNAEAIRVVSIMNGWMPMKIDNMPIDYYKVLSVVFWVQPE